MTFSAVISQKNILLFNTQSTEAPIQLLFEKKYGKIVRYEHYGDGYIVVAFANGFLSHVSTHSREMSKFPVDGILIIR
jgi:hypothetical protein